MVRSALRLRRPDCHCALVASTARAVTAWITEVFAPRWTGVWAEVYYPAVSLYKAATVEFNFGPTFAHPPPPAFEARPVSELAAPAAGEGVSVETSAAEACETKEGDRALFTDTAEATAGDEGADPTAADDEEGGPGEDGDDGEEDEMMDEA